jgi:hypothetical protein
MGIIPKAFKFQRFLDKMCSGFPRYNCFVNSSKTLSNVENANLREVSFCGAILNVKSKESRMDFQGYHNSNIVHSMTFKFWNSDTEER